uniref:Uncharacterized protein n=1 Tax=Anguilla anguilla TaxID=7936 RepID=A0A0E9TKH3_ANGAN
MVFGTQEVRWIML